MRDSSCLCFVFISSSKKRFKERTFLKSDPKCGMEVSMELTGNSDGEGSRGTTEQCVNDIARGSLGAKGCLLKRPGKAALSLESSSTSEKAKVKHEAHPQVLRGI